MILELKTKAQLHLARKLSHIIIGIIAIFIAHILREKSFQIQHLLVILFIVAVITEYTRHHIQKFNLFFMDLPLLKYLLREEEKNKVATVSYYITSMTVCFWFYRWEIAIISILYLTLADPIASIAGHRFGKYKIYRNKSVVGFLSFMLCCLMINIVLAKIYWNASYLFEHKIIFYFTPIIAAMAESLLPLEDNLTIPITTGAFMHTILYFNQ
ncbi:MAG: hypothetical protein OEW87_12275 [Flavobacteriaceae bacterium]|nr:hypothetical protein [Flavobacteriaceae bacterium]